MGCGWCLTKPLPVKLSNHVFDHYTLLRVSRPHAFALLAASLLQCHHFIIERGIYQVNGQRLLGRIARHPGRTAV